MFHSNLDVDIPKGSIILFSGPPRSGTSTIVKHICLNALEREEAVIYISTKDSGDKIYSWFSERTDTRGLGILDCISKSLRMETNIEDTENIKYVSSAVDLTGISVKYSSLLEELWNVKKYTEMRVVIDSLSTLLMYSNEQTVFRFLHILTGRVRKIDGYGIFTMDETSEKAENSSINQLIDVITEVKENKMIYKGFGVRSEVKFEIKNENLILEEKE